MPGFLYLISLISVTLWTAVGFFVSNVRPNSLVGILGLIFLLFFAFGATSAIPIFAILRKKRGDSISRRFMIRKTLKWAFFFSFGLTGMAFLKAFSLINWITVVLFLLLYVILYLQISGNR